MAASLSPPASASPSFLLGFRVAKGSQTLGIAANTAIFELLIRRRAVV
jgi:hypothetical protein